MAYDRAYRLRLHNLLKRFITKRGYSLVLQTGPMGLLRPIIVV